MTLAAMANYEQRNPAGYCGAFTSCAAGGAVPAGKVATAVLFGRRSGVVFELTLGAQSWNSRKARFFEDQVALRESRGALLFRYSPPRRGKFSYAVLGGISRTVGDVRGMDRVQEAVIPVGGRHVIAARDSKSGVTFGADVERVIGGGISLVVPIRITQVIGQLPQYWTTSTDVHAGIGVSVRVFRHIGYASGR
jgi:hypothetical protein